MLVEALCRISLTHATIFAVAVMLTDFGSEAVQKCPDNRTSAFDEDPSAVCYEFFGEALDFEQAAKSCLADGGYLPDLPYWDDEITLDAEYDESGGDGENGDYGENENSGENKDDGEKENSGENVDYREDGVERNDSLRRSTWLTNGKCIFSQELVNLRHESEFAIAARECFEDLRSTFQCSYASVRQKCGGDEWIYFSGVCFKVVTDLKKFTYDEAKTMCEREGAHPAPILTPFDNIVGQHLLPPAQAKGVPGLLGGVWIGLELEWEGPCPTDAGESPETEKFKPCQVAAVDWGDGKMHTSGLLPQPIRKLTRLWGKYPWTKDTQPEGREDTTKTCVIYTNQEGYSIGEWNDVDCNDRFSAVLCQKEADE